MATFTWLDWLIVVWLIVNFLNGFRLGFVKQLFGLLGLVVALYISLNYSPYISNVFSSLIQDTDIPYLQLAVNLIAFMVLFIGVRIIFGLLGRIIHLGTYIPLIGSLNGMIGGLFGLVKGSLLVFLVLGILYVLPIYELAGPIYKSYFFGLFTEVWPQLVILLEDILFSNIVGQFEVI